MGFVGYALVLLVIVASLAIIIILLVSVAGYYAQSAITESLESLKDTEFHPTASLHILKRSQVEPDSRTDK